MKDVVNDGVRLIPIKALGKTYTIWTKKVGNNPKIKILLLHGGPGANHMFYTCFEPFFREEGFEFYYYDQLGSYQSDLTTDKQLWNIPRFVNEVEQVRIALGLDKNNFYLYGNSWGGLLALEYAHKYQEHLKGLIISSMQASMTDYNQYANNVLAKQLAPEAVQRIRELEALEDYGNSEYEKLLKPFYKKFVLRMKDDEIPDSIKVAQKYVNRQIYEYMNGPSEFGLVGTLKSWSFKNRLKTITVPTLFIGSTYNTMDPVQMKWMALEVKNGEYHHCPNGSHMAMWDDTENYMEGLLGFVKRMEEQTELNELVGHLMETKLKALEEKDLDLYMDTVSKNSQHYINEQKHWFESMSHGDIHDLTFDVIQVSHIDLTHVKAIIRQRHTYFEPFDITYPLIFEKQGDVIKDIGYNFHTLVTPRYVIRYMQGDDRVERLVQIIETAFDRVENIFHKKVESKVEFKLYSNRELLRQRTMPTMRWQFYGWQQPDESIKLYSGLENMDSYHGLVQHELVHMLASSIAHGHTSSWLSEGLAVKYGNADYNLDDDIIFSHLDRFDLRKTLNEIQTFDFANAADKETIDEWYGVCGSYVNFLIDQFGLDQVMAIFKEADRIAALYDEIDAFASIDITKEAIINVLGVTQEQISEEYLHSVNFV